jgi:nitrate reductase cytochrome c-type subunit
MIFSTGHSQMPPLIRFPYRIYSVGLATFALTLTLTLALVAGCSPPPPTTAKAHLSVDMPNGDGIPLTDASIEPPHLLDIGTSAQAVAMRTGDGATPKAVPVGKNNKTPDNTPIAEEDAVQPVSQPGVETIEFPEGVDGPEDYRTWQVPDLALVVTGQQHGYIEPCGCTGLDRQKGGVARRFTFMRQLREMGWTLLPLDAGDQVRRYGRQAEVKLQQTVKALKLMDYQGIGFGPNDVRLGVGELLAVAAGDTADDTMYASANVVLIDPSLMPQTKLIERNGRKVGITSILDPDSLDVAPSDEILVKPIVQSARQALAELEAGTPDFKVLLFFGSEDVGKQLVRDVPGFDLIVAAGSYGEPTFQAESIKETNTKMIVTGNKGMYAGLVGLYPDKRLKYARVPLTHEFEDAPEMRQLMKEYQDQLRDIGLQGLGLLPPIPHSSGQKFIGTAKCGECHTSALDVWEGTPHAEATAHIVRPPKERGDIPRHFDPECISCHVTGWNPQEFYPYASGYLSLQETEHLTGSGCEGCHGPGSDHAAAEADGSTVAAELRDQLRDSMKLPLEKAREKCMTCHDLDNSPDFHEDDAFEDIYWPEVEHYGLD